MKRALFWVVSCGGREIARGRRESRKDIDEILRGGLATILEEDEPGAFADGDDTKPLGKRSKKAAAKGVAKRSRSSGWGGVRTGRCGRVASAGIASSYVRFITGFASKGGLVGLSRF